MFMDGLESGVDGMGMADEVRPAGWSETTDYVLRYAAWHADRRVPVDKWERALRERGGFAEMHEAARAFLAEFGGLGTDDWTPGPVNPRSPFRFDPRAAEGEGERFGRFCVHAGVDLYPIGVADSGRSFLAMAPDGTVWIGGGDDLDPDLDPDLEPLANTAYEAIEKLVMTRGGAGTSGTSGTPGTPEPSEPVAAGEGGGGEIGTRWSAETDRVLRLAGWRPGRAVPTEEWERVLHENDEGYVMHDAARAFLAEFGGLEVQQKGPGRTMARPPFRLDPLVAKYDFEIIDVQSEEMGTYLYPLGDTDRANFYLTMSATGAVYLGMDYPRLLADSGDQALDKLIQGIA
jgi:hypothetical protein